MKTLILHPTELCQWYALVNEAQASTSLILNENTESYLVFLLMRFSKAKQLVESIVALDFLEAMHRGRHQQIELLKEVGDKSLLCCGLFPGLAERHRVTLDYFIEVGQTAYLMVARREQAQSSLYGELSDKFLRLQQVLGAIRHKGLEALTIDCVNLNALFH